MTARPWETYFSSWAQWKPKQAAQGANLARLFSPHLNPASKGYSASVGSFCPPKAYVGSPGPDLNNPNQEIEASAWNPSRPWSSWRQAQSLLLGFRPGRVVWVTTRGRSSPAFPHSCPSEGWPRCGENILYHLFPLMLFLHTASFPREF